MSMELSNYLVRWGVTYLGDLQPTYIGGYNQFTKYHGHPSMLNFRGFGGFVNITSLR